MAKTLTIVRKNLQISLNAKASSLILILGPLILIALIGFALQDTSIKNIKASVFIGQQSDAFSINFLNKLSEKSFQASREESLEACKNKVVNGESHVCIELKKENELALGYPIYNVNLNVDFSKQRIVWQIIGSVQGIVEQEASNTRGGFSTNIEQNTEYLSKELENQEEKINTALSKIETMEKILELKNKEGVSIENSLNKIQKDISEIKGNLIGLPSMENTISKLDKINNDLNKISEGYKGTGNLGDNLNASKIELENAKTELKKLQQNLGILNDIDIEAISNPITVSYESISDNEEGIIEEKLEAIDYLFPTFIMFFILFGATTFTSIIRIKDRQSNSYIRNITSRIKGINFILSDVLTCLFLMIIQLSIIFMAAYFFLNISLIQNLIPLTILLVFSIVLFSFIGNCIGSCFNSQESVIITSVSISILFFLFSSIIIPVEMLPSMISKIVSILPLTLLESKLRMLLIFNVPIKLNFLETLGIGITILGTSLITFVFYKKNKEKEL